MKVKNVRLPYGISTEDATVQDNAREEYESLFDTKVKQLNMLNCNSHIIKKFLVYRLNFKIQMKLSRLKFILYLMHQKTPF